VKQVTFVGDKHPTCGVVSTFTWQRLANHLGVKNNDKVLSFKIEQNGLTVYWQDGTILGRESVI
jgi:hypothetical protein